tara:strand:- start:5316 stop:7049 length:1734 start_codon:yes stop_codon:yes gene_type:complete
MEVYKDISNTQNQKFQKLLIDNFSKTKIEEGKLLTGRITKISEKHIFLLIDGMKSEALIDKNEAKTVYGDKPIKENDKLEVYLEKIEDKNGEVIVSATRAQKIRGWYVLEKAYENNENVRGKIVSKCKGGVIVEHIDTKSLMFCPGSQIDSKPLKSFDHLFNVEQDFKIIKLDKFRGNACVSRREVISSFKKEDKAKILEKYNVDDVIKNAVVKGYTSFGCFFEINNEIDCLVHLQEISYSRINHPDEIFSIGEKHDLKIIAIDKDKMQISCSIKALTPDPFENISNYEVGKSYKAKVIKVVDYGAFCELQPGLTCLLHSSEVSWSKKNVIPNKFFKINDVIDCVITDIDKEKKRIAISHKLAKENPYESFEKKYPLNSVINCKISNIKDFSIYLNIPEFDIDGFLHANDLSYNSKPEDEVKKYSKGDEIKVKVIEIKPKDQKIKLGVKQLEEDPFNIFKDKKINDVLTVKVKSTSTKGIVVSPENSNFEILIKKNQIAINTEDARSNRFIQGDRIDAAISEINFDKRKISLSIKLLEEMQNKEAVSKFSSPLSGKNLPFSSLSEKLDNNNKKKEEK